MQQIELAEVRPMHLLEIAFRCPGIEIGKP
jgi:hypothetical protein